MNLTGGNENMHPRTLGLLHSLPRGVNVPGIAPRETAYDGDVPFLVDAVSDLSGDRLHGLEVRLAGCRKPGLDDVDAELGELARDVQLLLAGHGGAGGLLAVSEGGVEDADVVGVGDAVGDVIRTAAYGGGGGEQSTAFG